MSPKSHRVDLDWLFDGTNLIPEYKSLTFKPKVRSLVTGDSCSNFSVLGLSLQTTTTCRNVRQNLFTESATAKLRLGRNLSANVEVDNENKADYVVAVEKPSQTNKARGAPMIPL